jgi:hypothetical protein
MNKKLLVEEDDHVLNCAKDLCLYARWPIGFAKLDECSQDICVTLPQLGQTLWQKLNTIL